MDRRTLIKAASCCTLSALGGQAAWKLSQAWSTGYEPVGRLSLSNYAIDPVADEGSAHSDADILGPDQDDHAAYLAKIRDFDRTYEEDLVLEEERLPLLLSTARRLTRVQKIYGHGHFNLLGFDEMLRLGRRYRSVGRFPKAEVEFLEELFFTDAEDYGFYGEKLTHKMTDVIPVRETVKISGTGHYLFRGEPHEKYEQMCRDLDDDIFLTSGIRGVVKQMQLFLDKAVTTDGNLSQASRSLAPPGYSYHAVGDFDIGKVGGGLDNFNDSFAETDEYKRLVDLGYAELRYTPTNPYGVRHEPWHIKMKA